MERNPQWVTFMRAWIVQKRPFELFLQGIMKNMVPFGMSLISDGTIYFIGLYMQLPTFLIQHTNSAQILRLSGLYDVIERMSPNAIVGIVIVHEIEMYKKALGDLYSQDLCKKNRTNLMPSKIM